MPLNENNLGMFTGTEEYHRWSFFRMVLTDGALYVAKNGGTSGAFWLMDAIASHQRALSKHEWAQEIQFWKLKVNLKTHEAVLSCRRDDGVKPAIVQKIEYSDFDLPEIDLWVAPGGPENTVVIYLPSEH